MVGLQSPASQIFRPAQTVSAVDVATQSLSPIAAIQPNYVVVTNRLAHRDGGGQRFFDNRMLTKTSKALMHARDEVGKLMRIDTMSWTPKMRQVAKVEPCP